jgi:prepilin-type processing-associated H-X9-DG protein
MVGGKTNVGHGFRGDVFTDGLFNINIKVRMREIIDGTANTLSVGESVHPALWGLGSGYGVATIGGPAWWFGGSGCTSPCPMTDRSLGREFRSTKYPINSSLMPMTPDEENEAPYGSAHMGGAQFVYADGHVAFLENTIDMNIYRSLGSYRLEDNNAGTVP